MKCVDCNAFQLTICIEYEIKTREVGEKGIEGNKIVSHDPAVLKINYFNKNTEGRLFKLSLAIV